MLTSEKQKAIARIGQEYHCSDCGWTGTDFDMSDDCWVWCMEFDGIWLEVACPECGWTLD